MASIAGKSVDLVPPAKADAEAFSAWSNDIEIILSGAGDPAAFSRVGAG